MAKHAIILACLVISIGLCVVHSEYTGKIDLGKLRGMDSKDRVANEFILVMKYNATNYVEKISSFVAHMKSTHPSSRLMDTYVIKNFIALRIHIPEVEATSLSEHPDVNFMQANFEVRASGSQGVSSCKKEATERRLWGLSRVSERELPEYTKAGYIYLNDDGDDVDAYVVDTGVLITHVEFEGRASHGFTATSIKEEGEGDSDENGHGTHVAGTLAGVTYGAAKMANIIAVKVLNKDGIGSTADVVEGIEYVHTDFLKKKETRGDKAKVVVNMSLGGGPFAVGGADEAAITMAMQDGIPFVVAAGNDAFDACFVSPSRISSAITVGATNIEDGLAYFSNHGPCVDILAPGEGILSAYIGSDTASAIASGTSMASPHVAGIVARYLSQQESMETPATVKAWVQNLATDGAVELDYHISTPNSLLYMACLADEAEEQPYSSDSMSFGKTHGFGLLDEDNAWMYVSVSLAVLMILCLLSIIMHCCTLSKTKRVLNNIHFLQLMRAEDFLPGQPTSGAAHHNAGYNYTLPAAYPSAPREDTKLLA